MGFSFWPPYMQWRRQAGATAEIKHMKHCHSIGVPGLLQWRGFPGDGQWRRAIEALEARAPQTVWQLWLIVYRPR